MVPRLIADAGETASWRYVEFFTANIRNQNTRRAYARACEDSLAWREARGLTLATSDALRKSVVRFDPRDRYIDVPLIDIAVQERQFGL